MPPIRPPVRPPPLRDLDPDAHLDDPARKQRYVTTLFDTVAPSYDRFTRWFSFGMDGAWKRQLANWAVEVMPDHGVLVDLACGTGAVMQAVGRKDGRTEGQKLRTGIGVDTSAEMLAVAARRLSDRPSTRPSFRLLRASMLAIPLPDGSVDVVTVGYGFRNAPDAGAALAEAARVLKPGGWLFDLDFFRPAGRAWRRLYLWYLRQAGRAVGRLRHGDPEAYGYIARSLERWLMPSEFRGLLERSGFAVEHVAEKLGGGICLHGARRRDDRMTESGLLLP
ncbi:MAG: ubiquinone/menaquinone biosynthesis methyltransferase [Gemmatimonadota bacterium]|nr:ubiquinone/menaquinone biosynthesis methyltransferase [Gemmatimonadota bacterium]